MVFLPHENQYQAHRTGGWKGRLAALERAGSPFGMYEIEILSGT